MNSKFVTVCSLVLFAACGAPPPVARAELWRLPIAVRPVAAAGDSSLRGLAAVDAEVAWVGGARGALFRTLDGGRSWQDVAPPDSADCDFRDVEALDRDSALAMVAGQPAKVFRTEDGGCSWRVVLHDERPTAFFDGLAFAGDFGALFGDPIDGAFGVWTTRDAGRTWSAVPAAALPEPLPGEAAFAASGTCIAIGDEPAPVIWIATGGGARARLLRGDPDGTWSAVDLPLCAGDAARGAFSLAVRGAGMLVVGGDYRSPRRSDGSAAYSIDGGASLHEGGGGAGGYRSAVVWVDQDRGLSVGSHGTSWTMDRGFSWRILDVGGGNSLARGRDGSLWRCGDRGSVARIEPAR